MTAKTGGLGCLMNEVFEVKTPFQMRLFCNSTTHSHLRVNVSKKSFTLASECVAKNWECANQVGWFTLSCYSGLRVFSRTQMFTGLRSSLSRRLQSQERCECIAPNYVSSCLEADADGTTCRTLLAQDVKKSLTKLEWQGTTCAISSMRKTRRGFHGVRTRGCGSSTTQVVR